VITTDLLSRGMDIKGVQHIVNYDSPATARVYVHRAGRTARAGRNGDVWTLLMDKDAWWFWKNVVGVIKRSHNVERIKLKNMVIPKTVQETYDTVIEI
jgi:ATP-dependent RNA helicase DDX51/DBP6